MRLNALKLSQPTVFACITFLLLTVMNLEQAWCVNAELVVLYHKNTNSYLTMHSNGKVSTVMLPGKDFTGNQCLEISTVSDKLFQFHLSIYNHATEKFLCFTKHGKLIGRKNFLPSCQFKESYAKNSNGYMQYESVNPISSGHDKHRYYVSFNRKGHPARGPFRGSSSNTLFLKEKESARCKSLINSKDYNETTYGQLTTTGHPKRHSRRKHLDKQRKAHGVV